MIGDDRAGRGGQPEQGRGDCALKPGGEDECDRDRADENTDNDPAELNGPRLDLLGVRHDDQGPDEFRLKVNRPCQHETSVVPPMPDRAPCGDGPVRF